MLAVSSWDTFFTDAWPHLPAKMSGLPGDLSARLDWPRLETLPRWIGDRRFYCKVWTTTDDRHDQVRSGVSTADAYLQAGSTVVWDRFEEAGLAQMLPQLAERTRSPMRSMQANALQTPAGSDVAMHFDCHEVCILQVSGSKRWWIAPNDQIHCPSYGYLDREGTAVLKSEAKTWPLRPPQRKDVPTFEVGPGEVTFVPRGWWHATRALTDSVSITMALVSKTAEELSSVGPEDRRARCVPRPSRSTPTSVDGCPQARAERTAPTELPAADGTSEGRSTAARRV